MDSSDWAELKELEGFGPAFAELEQLVREPSAADIVVTILGVIAIIAIIFVLWIVLAAVLRYVSETALISMVNEYEKTGVKRGIREGLRMGWSRKAWRLFLIDLVVHLPVTLVLIALLILSLLPLLLWFSGSVEVGIAATLISMGLMLPLIFLFIFVGALLTLLTQFFRRVCVIQDEGVLASIGQGFNMVRWNLKEVILMALIVLGITIAFIFAMIPISIMLIPVLLLLLVPGLALGGAAALFTGGIFALLFDGLLPFVAAGVVGIPILVIVLTLPWVFIGGLYEVYISSTWTLTYRQLRALAPEKVQPVYKEDAADFDPLPAKG